MGIMSRMVQLCKADIHGVMDQIEDKGLLLKQLLREMEEELKKKEAELQKIIVSRNQTIQEVAQHERDREKLDTDIRSAIIKNKDEIAKGLIKKEKQVVFYQENLKIHIQNLNQDIDLYEDTLKARQRQYQKLKLRAIDYFREQEHRGWEKNLTHFVPKYGEVEPSIEEIELEFLKRKEAVKGGES
jgi:phage shock protein A